ncbi:hypothetical protein CDL12_09502 [Handroanthus impetiginosus]|uniref:BTB domain-containing protein n=1 Tax=Handroanthus impetiginosus TaxID=429701 RepID=A0A2G9HKL1_9LAMI|nr:hypothetical protein CDL12_09502 [Handroanthus impetiginosus]
MLSDFQVDVNGQQTFFVNMKLIASFSHKLQRLFNKQEAGRSRTLKLILHDFPGGAEGFELILRFCYNGGRIEITPSNIFLLYSAAKFLEINEAHIQKHFENVHFWTWSEILDSLKRLQELLSFMCSSYVVQEILDCLVEKILNPNISSPFSFSCSDNSIVQFSGDISISSSRFSSFQTSNWLRDLEFLNVVLFDNVVSTMFSFKLDRGMICSFLLHYQKMKFFSVSPHEKCEIIKVVISSLPSLKSFCFPFRSLCDMLQACYSLKMDKYFAKILERMIGQRLDEATLDDLLVPYHGKRKFAYDVNLILRLLRIFLRESKKIFFLRRLKKVGFLIDLYLEEVAPDPNLKPCKFLALVSGVPDAARESYDRVYEVMDLYFEVHKFISEEEKIKVCSVLKYDKLSRESLVNLSKNAEFPASAAYTAKVFLKSKPKILSKEVKDIELRKFQKKSANVDRTNIVFLIHN